MSTIRKSMYTRPSGAQQASIVRTRRAHRCDRFVTDEKKARNYAGTSDNPARFVRN